MENLNPQDGTAEDKEPIIRIRSSLKKLINAYIHDKPVDVVIFIAERKNQKQKTNLDPYLDQSEWQPSPERASLSG